MLAFALVHAILIVGEAAGKVTAELRDQHPQVPWALITGMRNRLVHAFFDINHDNPIGKAVGAQRRPGQRQTC
jgi:uncharacterized protein with HEPN domain